MRQYTATYSLLILVFAAVVAPLSAVSKCTICHKFAVGAIQAKNDGKFPPLNSEDVVPTCSYLLSLVDPNADSEGECQDFFDDEQSDVTDYLNDDSTPTDEEMCSSHCNGLARLQELKLKGYSIRDIIHVLLAREEVVLNHGPKRCSVCQSIARSIQTLRGRNSRTSAIEYCEYDYRDYNQSDSYKRSQCQIIVDDLIEFNRTNAIHNVEAACKAIGYCSDCRPSNTNVLSMQNGIVGIGRK